MSKKTFNKVDHDATPVVGMIIAFEIMLGKLVAVPGDKICLVLDTSCNKMKPFFTTVRISMIPGIRGNVEDGYPCSG